MDYKKNFIFYNHSVLKFFKIQNIITGVLIINIGYFFDFIYVRNYTKIKVIQKIKVPFDYWILRIDQKKRNRIKEDFPSSL